MQYIIFFMLNTCSNGMLNWFLVFFSYSYTFFSLGFLLYLYARRTVKSSSPFYSISFCFESVTTTSTDQQTRLEIKKQSDIKICAFIDWRPNHIILFMPDLLFLSYILCFYSDCLFLGFHLANANVRNQTETKSKSESNEIKKRTSIITLHILRLISVKLLAARIIHHSSKRFSQF